MGKTHREGKLGPFIFDNVYDANVVSCVVTSKDHNHLLPPPHPPHTSEDLHQNTHHDAHTK
ncbi:hypothetical protein CFP56_040125 [Quercus suber]|uniref:Uncharacterized protein n=1 Tax=Quercus suber TaxID=58331 RepID=A0AAW0LMA7_QUESU